MGAKQEAEAWAETVRKLGERQGLSYEPVGGINPKDGPVALCVGGRNRLTGQLPKAFGDRPATPTKRRRGGYSPRRCCPARS